jgi:uncharacterized membrane protein YdfJ with MMPL/SSD domain
VTVAYFISRGIVAALGASLITITSYTNVLLVVILYGAGTDYCLFLISRFREEMADENNGVEPAVTRTVHRVGETISSSAGTIFVGFTSMIFSEMGMFKTTGPALAFGIVTVLLAGLTFVPALLATLSNHAFCQAWQPPIDWTTIRIHVADGQHAAAYRSRHRGGDDSAFDLRRRQDISMICSATCPMTGIRLSALRY